MTIEYSGGPAPPGASGPSCDVLNGIPPAAG